MSMMNTMTFEKILTEKVKSAAFILFLCSVPIFYVYGISVEGRILQERYFQFAAMVLGSLFFGNIYLTLFFLLNLLSWAWNGFEVGSSQVFSVFFTGILFACSRNFFTKHSFKPFAVSLYVVAVISIIFMIFQTFGMDPLHHVVNHKNEVMINESSTLKMGLFSLPPFNSIFLTLVAALMIFLHSWLGLFLILAAFDARCSASFLAWAFLIPFWFYWKKFNFKVGKIRVFLFIPVLILTILGAGYYSYRDYKGDKLTYISRFESWHMMISKTLQSPFIGWGPDSLRQTNKNKNFLFRADDKYTPIMQTNDEAHGKIYVRYYSANKGEWKKRFEGKLPPNMTEEGLRALTGWDTAHNDYLQEFFELGIGFVVLLVFFFREFILRFRLADKTPEVLALFSCLVVYALVSTTQFPFHLARLSGIYGIILGAYFAVTDKNYLTMKGLAHAEE